MIEFVACNESQIHTFRHFQALIFVCTTLHAYNLNIFFLFLFSNFGRPSAVFPCTHSYMSLK